MKKKEKEPLQKGSLAFIITGENFTRLARDMWLSDLPKNALSCCVEGLGLSKEQAVEVLTGKKKMTGATNEGDGSLFLEDDNTEVMSLEEAVRRQEYAFYSKINEMAALKRKIEIMGGIVDPENPKVLTQPGMATKDAGFYRKAFMKPASNWAKDCKTEREFAAKMEEDLKEILEHLEVVYDLSGKTLKDLPFMGLGTQWSTVEYDTYAKSFEFSEKAALWKRAKYDGEVAEIKKEREVDKVWTPKTPTTEDIRDKKYSDGWISPEGYFYPCGFQGHTNLAYTMQYLKMIPESFEVIDYFTKKPRTDTNADAYLEKNGWIKLTGDEWMSFKWQSNMVLTEKQNEAIMDYMESRGLKKIKYNGNELSLKEIMKDEEGLI